MTEATGRGSRIGAALFAFAIGAVFGAIGTVAHQSRIDIAGVSVPWGLILAVVGVAALLVGLRLVVDDRLVVGACALGLLGVIVLLSLKSVGGSVLIPDSVSGLIWILSPAVIGGLVIAWPRLPQGSSARRA